MSLQYQPALYSGHGIMHQKPSLQPQLRRITKQIRPVSTATNFEEDDDVFVTYPGRMSEDSTGQQSFSTLNTLNELDTPAVHHDEFAGYNFSRPTIKYSITGPTGPHLFRMSQDSVSKLDTYLDMSPTEAPEAFYTFKPAPAIAFEEPGMQYSEVSEPIYAPPPRTSVPLRTWTPAQVGDWMHSIGMEQIFIEQFLVNDISGTTLLELEYNHLKELGLTSFGVRQRLWNAVKALRETNMGSLVPFTPGIEMPLPSPPPLESYSASGMLSPTSPPGPQTPVQHVAQRRGRHAKSSSRDAAIDPHYCNKGQECSKWQTQQRKLEQLNTGIAAQLPELSKPYSPSAILSMAAPSVVASSDLFGIGGAPKNSLRETALQDMPKRDPQETVRQYLSFQHVQPGSLPLPSLEDPFTVSTPVVGRSNLQKLPKLSIPNAAPQELVSANRTAVPPHHSKTPVTAISGQRRAADNEIWRMASPASEMDVPVTAQPHDPYNRDVSSSVPPDMRFGLANTDWTTAPYTRSSSRTAMSRSASRTRHHQPPPVSFYNQAHPQTLAPRFSPPPRSGTPHRHSKQATLVAFKEVKTPVVSREQEVFVPSSAASSSRSETFSSPRSVDRAASPNTTVSLLSDKQSGHAGYMRKRKTKFLRHEWHENYYRLNGTTLAMHHDAGSIDPLESISVDDYAVAVSTGTQNKKFNAALKKFSLSGKPKVTVQHDTFDNLPVISSVAPAFGFQLVPAVDKNKDKENEKEKEKERKLAALNLFASDKKTHHFAVQSASERIEWMRELMLARAKGQSERAARGSGKEGHVHHASFGSGLEAGMVGQI